MAKLLEIKHLEKYYGNKSNVTKALNDISLSIDQGEFVAIMGASGSGKTTLLNVIATIDKATAGQILVRGEDITKLRGNALNRFRREELGFIFQDFNLLNTLTAEENIALALTIQHQHGDQVTMQVREIAEKLGIGQILSKYPYQLSGGEKQRVAAARAIIASPQMILADEPTGALDSKSSRQLLETMDYLNQSLEATILMVTHDAFAASYSSRVIFIKDGQFFNELVRGKKSRKDFFSEIIGVMALLGGNLNDAL